MNAGSLASPEISIIIVNYNSTEFLIDCLNSIKHHLFCNYEVIVIDNNSTDFNLDSLITKFPQFNFQTLKENIGFGAANNLAAQSANAEYLLLLNPDTQITQDFITPVLSFMNGHTDAGGCAPALVYEDGSYQNSTGTSTGAMFEIAEAFSFINFWRHFANRKYRNYENDTPVRVSWASAAAFIIRKKIFNQLGGFDKDFFLNYEDIDLNKRIGLAGYNIYYFPHLKCLHVNQASQKKDYRLLVLNRYESKMKLINKYYNGFKKKCIYLMHTIGLALKMLFVNFLYKGSERKQRYSAYYESIKLYLNALV